MSKDNTQKDAHYLAVCRSSIEEQLHWGDSSEWSNTDFMNLSELIEKKTGKPISHTTLKRIWGKVKYTNIPQTHTLNTLAEFADFESWLLFKNSVRMQSDTKIKEAKVENPELKATKNKSLVWKVATAFGILILATTIISFIYRNQRKVLPKEMADKATFTSKPIVEGIPNTVIFNYDVSQIQGHIYEIQQSWDKRKQFTISPDKNEVTSVYYYPGYFRAKLLVDEQIIKEHDLLITTKDWLGLIQQNPTPKYLLEDEIVKNGFLGVNEMVKQQILGNPEKPKWLNFNYVDHKLLDFDCDNMSFEISLKNTYYKGDDLCKRSRIVILGSEGIFAIPLAYKGCTGDIGLKFRDTEMQGPKDNLTSFGCDFKEWEKLRFETKNKNVKLFLNDNLIQELSYNDAAGKLAGIRIKFMGLGQINYIKIENKEGKTFYNDFGEVM